MDYADDSDNIEDAYIEPVSFEENQELLRAFGGQAPQAPQPVAQQVSASALAVKQALREPLYCFCKNVSYGDMIACDNKQCPYEWFHFACVGLMAKPEGGKWYCQKCQILLGGPPSPPVLDSPSSFIKREKLSTINSKNN